MSGSKTPEDQAADAELPEPAAAAASAPVTAAARGRLGHAEIGYLFAAVGAILFSTKGIIIKLAYVEGLDAEIVIALRMAMALPIYLAIGTMAVIDRKRRGDPLPSRSLVVRAALVGMIGYGFASYTDFLGLEFISAQFERLILFTYPLFVVVLGAMFFNQPLRMSSLAAIGVSYGGLVLIFVEKYADVGPNVALGGGLVMSAALAFALYQLLAKNIIAEMGPRLFTCVAMSGAAIAAFVLFSATHPPSDLIVSPRAYWLMFGIAVGATVLPSFFLSAALHRISAQANATIGTLSPVATILMAVFILGETITLIDVAGTVLVLAGVGWFTLGDRARAKSG